MMMMIPFPASTPVEPPAASSSPLSSQKGPRHSPAPSAKEEAKKRAQLRNYTIAAAKGVQYELPLGVSWKDLKAILASSNISTTERVVKSIPLPLGFFLFLSVSPSSFFISTHTTCRCLQHTIDTK